MQSHVYSVISIHHWEETKGMEVTEWTFMLLFASVVDDSYAAFEWRATKKRWASRKIFLKL